MSVSATAGRRSAEVGFELGAAGDGPRESLVLGALRRHAAARPREVAVRMVVGGGSPDSDLTWSALEQLTRGLGTELRRAVAPDEVVMLRAPNGPRFLAWFLAGVHAGVRIFPVSPQLADAEIAAAAKLAGVKAVIAPAGAGPRVDLRRIDLESPGERVTAGDGRDAPRPPGAIVLHSSGTTGASRMVLRESAGLDADARAVIEATGLTSDDRVLLAVPMCHSYGVDMLVAAVVSGATIEAMDAFDPFAAARALTESSTVFPGVPFMFDALAHTAPGAARPALRLAFSAGSPLSATVRAAFDRAWGHGSRVGDLYGASELGTVTFNHPRSSGFDTRSVGTPIGASAVSVRVLDPRDEAREMALGEEGHVAIRAESMLSRYLDAPAPLVDGHLLTGDLGRLDAAGRLFITGRIKLLIDCGGVKVNPLEVERVLGEHPGVDECVVLPLVLSETNTRLRAVYTVREGAAVPSAEELRAFMRARVSAAKVPRVFEPVEAMPRTAAGKIDRRALEERGSACT